MKVPNWIIININFQNSVFCEVFRFSLNHHQHRDIYMLKFLCVCLAVCWSICLSAFLSAYQFCLFMSLWRCVKDVSKVCHCMCLSIAIGRSIKWGKVLKNGPNKICGRQLLKNFTWPILEYSDPYVTTYVTVFLCFSF